VADLARVHGPVVMGVGVGDGLLVTGSTVVEGGLAPAGSPVGADVCEPLGVAPPAEDGSVVVVGWSVLWGAVVVAPASGEAVFVLGDDSVRLSGVTVVRPPRVDPVLLRLRGAPECEWPAGADRGAVAGRCTGRAAGLLTTRRAVLTSLAAVRTATEWAGPAVLAEPARVANRKPAGRVVDADAVLRATGGGDAGLAWWRWWAAGLVDT
jgi:hypothetical protein